MVSKSGVAGDATVTFAPEAVISDTGITDAVIPEAATPRSHGIGRWRTRWSGAPDRPRWERPGLAALLVATAVLYLWGLRSAGWTNPYYAAAVQSGTRSWKALLFAALDPGNGVTVDKPPAAMWVMGLSGRLFGFDSWSMLVPQAVMGVATVALLYGTVRRCSGPAAGLLAGTALAVTPVAALMFRYDNPDALMTLLVVAAAYAVVRSLRSADPRWLSASTGWIALAGVAIGFGFLAKMMQAFLVLPGLALAVLIAAPGGVGSRLAKLATAGVAVVVSAGWYVALVQWWPSGSRPYVGGSTDNSLWQLAVDYNGLGRLLGNNHRTTSLHSMTSHVAAAAQRATHPPIPLPHWGGMASGSGFDRLFQDSATEYAWLLPVAVVGLVAGLWSTRSRPRTDRERAGLILWGGWLFGTVAVLGTMNRNFHTYYTVELTPAIAALAGIGGTLLWRRRDNVAARVGLAVAVIATGAWVFVLLGRTPDWLPGLRWTLLGAALITAALLVLGAHRTRRWGAVLAAVAVVVGLTGPAAYAVQTVALPHTGGSPYSGPARADGRDRTPPVAPRLDALLAATDNRWAAATVGSFDVSAIELRTGASLLAIGGFSGRDDAPSLAEFRSEVASGQVHYFLVRGTGTARDGGIRTATALSGTGFPAATATGGSVTRSGTVGAKITAWVRRHYAVTTVDGYQVYDLTAPPIA